jgi:hypothetical protein
MKIQVLCDATTCRLVIRKNVLSPSSGLKSRRTEGNQTSLYARTPPLPRDLADLKARIIAAVKNIDAPIWTCVRQELEYRINVCRVTRGAHIEQL